MAMNSWLQNDNGDGTQQLPDWLQAIIKGGAAGGTTLPSVSPASGSPDANASAPIAAGMPPMAPASDSSATPGDSQKVPDWFSGAASFLNPQSGAQDQSVKPPMAPASDTSDATQAPTVKPDATSAAAPAPVPSATPQATPGASAPAQNAPDGILSYQDWKAQHAVPIPGRPLGPFDKIPDGQPGADSWRNQHNTLRQVLATLAAGAAEFGGRDPWGTNGHPGEGEAIMKPWLDAKAEQRAYDQNVPAMQEQANQAGYAKYVEAAKNAAQANSQFVLDPTTGRLIPVKVAVAQTAAQPKMLSAGFNPATGKPLTEEESSRAQNAKVELDASHKELYEAQQAQALAKADLDKAANDPNSPLYQLKLKQYEMTQKRFQLATERVNLAYRNFGVNTYGIDFGNNSALQSGAAAGAPTGHAQAPGGGASNPAINTNTPHGVPQGNDNQTLVPNGPAIKAARQSMASGEDHKAVLAFNTASGHLSQLQDAIDALNNNDITVLNRIANKYGVATGQSAPVVFDAIRNAVAGELGKVFKGQVTDSEVEHIGSTLGNDLSPQALSGVVKADANLMMSKLSAVHDAFFGLTGEHPYVLYPEGATAFKKLGVELPSWASAASQPTNRTKQPEAPATAGTSSSTFNPATDFKPIGKH